ncbi:anti-sigma-L factor RslA [Humibacter antri]
MNDHEVSDRAYHADHARFAEWDAAYVLGALSPADRRAYEEHLASCPACSAAVRELAGVPGLLGALPTNEAVALLLHSPPDAAESAPMRDMAAPDLAPPDLVPALLHRVRHRRRVRRWSLAGAIAGAAAVAAAVALVVPAVVSAPPAASVATSLHQVGSASGSTSPLAAQVTLTPKKWGTSIGMVCTWKADSSWSPGSGSATHWDYGLWVVARDGTTDRVATWSAGPGDVVRTTDSTAIPVSNIERIELRALDTGAVLLAAPVHPGT